MKKRLCSAFLAFCLTLTLCPAAFADEIRSPDTPAPVVNERLEALLDDYFGTILTRGFAVFDLDYEDMLNWMSAEVLDNSIIRVEGLSEQEKTVDDVSYTVQSYDPDTGELSADVTETVDGETFVTTHTLRAYNDIGAGWFIESDSFRDPLIHDLLSAEFLGAPPEPTYDHPNTWTNTGNQAKDIVGIALSQHGYAETGDNRTKYNVWFYGGNTSAAWCAIFISWCANQAKIPTSILKKNALASGFSTSNMSRNSFGVTPHAFGTTTAKPGDIAYIDNNKDNISNHVGLVYAADSNYVYTIEGNCSNKVIKRQYSATTGRIGSSNTKIVFLARPKYVGDGGTDPVTPDPVTPEPVTPPEPDSTLAIRPAQSSYRVARGNSCDIGGYVNSNYPLTTVTGKLDTGWSVSITNVGDKALDIGTSKLNSFDGASLAVGKHTLTITASDSKGKTVSKSISIEVYEEEPSSGNIKTRFDFRADVRFPSRAVSIYRNPGDETPYTQYDQNACVCEKGVTLTDDSVWLAFKGLSGTFWFPLQYDIDVTPRVTFSPEALSVRIGETKTVSVEYSYTPDVRRIAWASAGDMVTFTETEIRLSSNGSYGSGKKDLRVTGRNEGAGSVSFDFYDPFGNTLPMSKAFFVTVQKTMSDNDMPSDVRDKNTYYYPAVRWAVERNIVQTSQFWPLGDCTRGAAVTFLWRLAGSPTPSLSNPFSDVRPSDDYYNAVLWALEKGITNGTTASQFSPDITCSRGQIVTFLNRYAGKPSVSTGNRFKDVYASQYYYNAVNWASALGVTQGYSDGTFKPQTTCNRAQIITFLYRYATNS